MWDARIRTRIEGPLAAGAARMDRSWLSPDRLTMAGLVLGVGSAGAAAAQWWGLSLALWLLSRAADGLDGPLARRRAATAARAGADRARRAQGTHAGGFLDITADFVAYGSTVVGVAVGATNGRGASWFPFLLVLLAYYVNGAAFLAFSSIAERAGRRLDDGRSLSFLGGLAEGAETIAVHSIWLLFPSWAALIASVWAGVVALSAAHRMVGGYRALR